MKNWNLMRVFRLLLGVYIIADGIYTRQWIFVVVGILFSLMPLLNIGCCPAGNCGVTMENVKQENSEEEILFEEVK